MDEAGESVISEFYHVTFLSIRNFNIWHLGRSFYSSCES